MQSSHWAPSLGSQAAGACLNNGIFRAFFAVHGPKAIEGITITSFGLPPGDYEPSDFDWGSSELQVGLPSFNTCQPLIENSISSLLCHYSHLYTADDIMDMILYIVRSVVSQGSSYDNGVDLARRRLISALGNDPRRARMLAWHAGQIVAVANEYLVSAPCEIMRLFMSYIFIIAFAQYYPRPQQPGRGTHVRLDLPNHHADQKLAIEEWIQTGGSARIGSAEDILADGSTKTIILDAQAMLQRLRSWGLAEKFAKILQSFENNGDQP